MNKNGKNFLLWTIFGIMGWVSGCSPVNFNNDSIVINSGGQPLVQVAPPASIVYHSLLVPSSFYVGVDIGNYNVPEVKGGAPTGFTISPSLPLGLSLNLSTGAISGTPTVISSMGTYTVIASNSGGSVSAVISLGVEAASTSSANPSANPKPTASSSASPSASISLHVPKRSFIFVNYCSYPVWFGITAGSVPNANCPCPTGSSCNTKNNVCYFNNPTPNDGNYQLSANGGTNTTPLGTNINGVIWSGAIGGRTDCHGGKCATADCGVDTHSNIGDCLSGMSAPATQAEFTLKTDQDYYDVEIIDGFNLGISITAVRNAGEPVSSDPYHCGAPGSLSPSSPSLGACTWQFQPPVPSDYSWVTNGGLSCTSTSDCVSPSICGLSYNPGHQALIQKTCGTLLGFWSANHICSIESVIGSPIPLSYSCTGTYPELFGCTNSIASCYQASAPSNCCGCVNWDKVSTLFTPGAYDNLTVPSTTAQCENHNDTWIQKIFPTLYWLKAGCPNAYTYPYDDVSSSFVCSSGRSNGGGINNASYVITYCPESAPNIQYSFSP